MKNQSVNSASAVLTRGSRLRDALREVSILGALFGIYEAARLLASNDLAPALGRAVEIMRIERLLDIFPEELLNGIFLASGALGWLASAYYFSAHYVVTPIVLVWIFWRHRDRYSVLRSGLVLATFAALMCYLRLPTAPPRFFDGFHDIAAMYANDGWWSANRHVLSGTANVVNELAAFPSMHAGWALWVAIAITIVSASWLLRSLGWLHFAITTVVVIGTGNHWLVDVVAGCLLMLAGLGIAWSAPRLWHKYRGSKDPGPTSDARVRDDAQPGRRHTVPTRLSLVVTGDSAPPDDGWTADDVATGIGHRSDSRMRSGRSSTA